MFVLNSFYKRRRSMQANVTNCVKKLELLNNGHKTIDLTHPAVITRNWEMKAFKTEG